MTSTTPINLFAYQNLAAQKLSKMALDYYNSSAWDEVTSKDNRAAFERYKLCPRMLVDGGIRRGTDVLKALELGAKAVLLGRPVLWGLAVAGEA